MFMKLLLVGLVVASGCSDDETTSNGTNNMTEPEPVRDQQTVPNQPERCDGCFDDGVCKTGTERLSCGSAGQSCVQCGENETCTDGACQTKRNCNSENCDGCCDANDQCVTGTQAAACGEGGALCQSCEAGSACIDQTCQAPCGPGNCEGCCNANGVCISVSTNTECGGGGANCANCAASGGTCQNDACMMPACADSCNGCCNGETCVVATTAAQCGAMGDACVACPADQRCASGVCVSNTSSPSGLWDIELISGEVDYWDYDDFSAPDPFLVVRFADPATQQAYRYETYPDSDTYSPFWNETVEAVPQAYILNGLVFDMYDSDLTGADGICSMAVTPTAADLGGGIRTTVCAEYPDVQVTWQVVPSP